jgi:hypothetical protein
MRVGQVSGCARIGRIVAGAEAPGYIMWIVTGAKAPGYIMRMG